MTSPKQASRASASFPFPGQIEVTPFAHAQRLNCHWEVDLILHLSTGGFIHLIAISGDGEKRVFKPGTMIGLRKPVGPIGKIRNARELVIDGESSMTLVIDDGTAEQLATYAPATNCYLRAQRRNPTS